MENWKGEMNNANSGSDLEVSQLVCVRLYSVHLYISTSHIICIHRTSLNTLHCKINNFLISTIKSFSLSNRPDKGLFLTQ